ncbi:hypothetical protein [Pendulispora albinea]|uniref:Uncharacterized protein n=1 Tax=Pendulispora albinea TaxID=2741071 RepID=A0ABZ2MC09_9BACT
MHTTPWFEWILANRPPLTYRLHSFHCFTTKKSNRRTADILLLSSCDVRGEVRFFTIPRVAR